MADERVKKMSNTGIKISFSFVLLFVASLAVLLAVPAGADAKDEAASGSGWEKEAPKIRVALKNSVDNIELTVDSGFVVHALNNSSVLLFRNTQGWAGKVYASGGGFYFQTEKSSTRDYAPCTKIMLVPSKDGMIAVNGTYYYGSVALIKEKDSTLTVINYVDMEKYLAGVLPGEMPLNWNDEALKAQVIAARTYALANMLERSDAEYDVFSTTASQVYSGRSRKTADAERARLIVEATRGIVMVDKGKVFAAYFCSSCGGRTEKANNVFSGEKDFATLSGGTTCRHCSTSDSVRWSKTVYSDTIEQNFRLKGVVINRLSEVKVIERGVSGRATKVELTHAGGKEVFNANYFRSIIGYGELKSTNFDISHEGDTYVFYGRGWGHGVGMCQYGADAMAKSGSDALSILEHYYPDCEFWRIY